MSGRLYVIGLGPGNADQVTPEALGAVRLAREFYGYKPYLDRLSLAEGQVAHASDNREEISRAEAALNRAAEGIDVAVVSGGDPGVFAMAAAVCEAIEHGPAAWRDIELTVVPGVTAMLAVAARAGAPLGHDFCAISLSDLLTPIETIEARVRAAIAGDFVIAFYNPASQRRREPFHRALALLREARPPTTPVIVARNLGREGERVETMELGALDPDRVDMLTLLIVGSTATRVGPSGVFTPRGYAGKIKSP